MDLNPIAFAVVPFILILVRGIDQDWDNPFKTAVHTTTFLWFVWSCINTIFEIL